MQRQAVIIGAGPAGLTAAYQLLRETDIHPIILEGSSAIGGISKTVEFEGNRIDIGGHRFFTKCPGVQAIWEELLTPQGSPARDDLLLNRKKNLSPTGADPEREDRVFLLRERVSRIYFKGKMFDYPLSINLKTIRNLGIFTTIRAGFGYLSSCLFKREEHSLEDFMINRFGTPLYRMFFEDYTQKVWGRHPREISADWGEQRIRGLSLSKAVLHIFRSALGMKEKETSLIEQFYYPKFGPGQLWEVMARVVTEKGAELSLGCQVVAIDNSGGRISSVTYEQDGCRHTIPCDLLFSSMPVKDLVLALKEEPEKEVRNIALGLPYRDFITVGMLVKKLKLKNESDIPTLSGLVPDDWIYIQDRGVNLGRLQIFNNWSPYLVEDLTGTVWLGLEYFCNEGDEFWNMKEDWFSGMAAEELARIGIIDEKDILKTVVIREKKAYPAYFDTYRHFPFLRDYLNGIENLYCIGRNGQHRYNNMDHSMLTALQAVKAVKGEASRESIWEVNTEQEYHESRA